MAVLKVNKDGALSLTGEQVEKYFQVIPFILIYPSRTTQRLELWLKPKFFEKEMREEMTTKFGNAFCKKITEALILVAKANRAVSIYQAGHAYDTRFASCW